MNAGRKNYFLEVMRAAGLAGAGVGWAAAWAYLRWKRSTRPAVSTNFILPVKNGWQAAQISTRMAAPFMVERVLKVFPQAQEIITS